MSATLEKLVRDLANSVESGFAAVAEDVGFIKTNMLTRETGVTRDAFETFANDSRGDFRSIRAELAEIDRRLATLEDGLADVRGYAKELDGLRSRLSDVERHLGLNQKIVA